MPVLTRLLSPEELGAYFVWLSAVTVLSVILSLRLDMAVFNVRGNRQLLSLLHLTIIASIALSFVFLIAVGGLFYLDLISLQHIGLDRWLIQGVVLAALWSVNMFVQHAYIYGAYFNRQAYFKVFQAIGVSFAQLAAVGLGYGINGMIILQILVTAVMVLWAIFDICKAFKIDFKQLVFSKCINELRRHWRFPVFSMPADFINSFAAQLPILMLGSRFGADSAGQFALTNKSMAAPIKILAGSILTVYKEESSSQYRETGQCRESFIKTLKILTIFGLPPFVGLFFLSEPIFAFVFGEKWRVAGSYAAILSPMFYLQFICSPLSYTLYIAGKQSLDLLWQIFLLAMTGSAFYFSGDAKIAVVIYSMGYSVLYVINLFMSYSAAKGFGR